MFARLALGLFAAVGCTEAVQVTYSGFVVDNLCFDKCQVSFPGCENCALDGTNVITQPEEHTVHCIRDVQACVDSGYALMQNAGDPLNPNYKIRYSFDGISNQRVVELINDSPLLNGFAVTAVGEDTGDGVLRNANFVACNTSATDCTSGICESGNCISLALTDSLQTSVSPNLVLLHGAFMICAWAFFAPVAWLIKRHVKTLPSLNLGRKVAGFPLAFLLHGGLMLSAVICTIIGVSIAFADFDWRSIGAHGPIGIIVFILAIWQPLPAILCRPSHESPRRIWFNRVHRTGGALALLLGALNVILGTMNYRTLWDNCIAPIFMGIAFALIGILALSAIILEYMSRKGEGDEK